MKAMMLRRLGGLGWSGGFNLLLQSTAHSSSVNLAQSRRQLQTVAHPARDPSSGSPSPAADHPRCWQVLNRCGVPKGSSVDVAATDAKCVAESRTSSGRPVRASVVRAVVPPAVSFIRVDGPSSENEFPDCPGYVVAAHGDTVLLQRIKVPMPPRRFPIYHQRHDYYVYRAAAGQPPSLTLLPTCCIPMDLRDYTGYVTDFPEERDFDHDTGILRRGGGDGEVLVAQLRVANDAPFDTAELCVLRPGRREWELKTGVPIVRGDDGGGGGHDLGMWQEPHVAVPVGDRLLCWANFDCSTFLVCDMAEVEEVEGAKLRYVPLPVKAVPPKEDEDYWDGYNGQPCWLYRRSIGAAGAGAVRFVSIDNRCCCGAPLAWGVCEHSTSTFVVSMWSLELRNAGEPMAWVKEGVLDCKELWAMASSIGLPRVDLKCPVVSSENPDIVCFVARTKEKGEIRHDTVESSWTLEIDVRRKKL